MPPITCAEKVCFIGCLLFLAISVVPASASSRNDFRPITQDCLEKSGRRQCAVFNKCCDFKCRQQFGYHSNAHYCTALLGQIIADSTSCVCSGVTAARYDGVMKKLDLVAGVLLIFIMDLFFLTFTL